jgi:coenzyme F420-0:L-glutamate ligase/coenzyme F420-1:gamma-L-glutamate ligase
MLVVPLRGIGAVRTGDDLAALLVAACRRSGVPPQDGDVLVVSSKVLAKALGLWHGDREAAVAQETRGVVAERRTPNGTTRIVRSAAGPVMAAAGVDASNTGPEAQGRVLVLPATRTPTPPGCGPRSRRPPGTRPAVLLTDTSGRPWRVGQTDFALGCAGLTPTDDLRGGTDADGAALHVTVRAVADELAAAAELVKGKADGVPAALVRGAAHLVRADDGPGAAGLVRFDEADWFATGTVESVRAALGCPPGTAGVEPAPAVPDGDAAAVLARAVAVVAAGSSADDELAGLVPVLRGGGAEVRVTAPAELLAAARLAERVSVACRAEGLRTRVSGRPRLVRVEPRQD